MKHKKISKSAHPKSLKGKNLEKIVRKHIAEKNFVMLSTSDLKGRKVHLDIFYEANKGRGSDRFRFLPCALFLLKDTRDHDECVQSFVDKNKKKCWEFLGEIPGGILFKVHIREEILSGKNKILRLISCFPV